jgi:quinol-cytochrome oxidoreductase complex cytochrome b subunit
MTRPASSSGRGHLRDWLDQRIGFGGLERLAKEKEVPLHRHTFWYYIGGMTLFLFTIQVTTGILLLLYYRPSPDNAYESVQFLMTQVQFGWLVRSIHAWSANLMILALFVHTFSVFFLKAYRPPREITWMSGVVLLGLALTFGFTGYLLPWNTLSFFATKVGTDIPGVVPLVGPFMLRLLRGGDDVTGATLTRFYGIHVAILPALTTALLAVHLFLVQQHGMSVPPDVERRARQLPFLPFFPNYLLRDMVGWLSALGLLAALAAFFPTELGIKADPFKPAPAGIRPEWYFLSMFQTLKYVPGHLLGLEGEKVAVTAFLVAGVLLLFVPFLDRRTARGTPSRLFTAIGVAALAYLVVLTWLGYAASLTR